MNTNSFLDKSYGTENQPLDLLILWLEEIIIDHFRKKKKKKTGSDRKSHTIYTPAVTDGPRAESGEERKEAIQSVKRQ